MSDRIGWTALCTAACLAASSCAGKSADQPAPPGNPPEQPLSARARESALAKSGLPGATGIGAALRVSDSAAARRQREDSIANSREP
jgi:hypothetical protein